MTTTINAINSTYPFSVANGGTGLASLTAHGILVGEGTSAVNPITLNNGYLLIGSTGADPVSATLTSTNSTIAYTTGAGSLSLDISAPVPTAYGGTGVISPTAHGIMIAEGASAMTPIVLTAGQVLIGTTASDPAGATLTAGAGISISSASGSITIATTEASGGGYVWNDITAGSATLAAGNAYLADKSTLTTFTLPATAAVGDSFVIMGKGTGGWTLVENASQVIHFGTITTTSTTGSLSSTNTRDTIQFVCTTANTDFTVMSSIGNIAYV